MISRFVCLIQAAILIVVVLQQSIGAYTCNTDKSGPLSIVIEKIPKIMEKETLCEFHATLQNTSAQPIKVSIETASIEHVKVTPDISGFIIPANGTEAVSFYIVCYEGTYNAHYPVHLFVNFEFDGQKQTLHPVQAFETDFGAAGVAKKNVGKSQNGNDVFVGDLVDEASQMPMLVVPNGGGVALTETEAYRVTCLQDKDKTNNDVPPTILNVGWQGNDERSRMHFSKTPMTRGGVNRKSLSVHPPYQGGSGTMFTEYLVQLPKATPITFSSFLAIRDVAPTEPDSDGVTFAVWVGEEKIGEKHSASKTWEPFQVDLSQFAGQTVLLRLQSDPGTNRDTTCDSAFWGTPLLRVGEMPKLLTAEEKKALFEENLKALQTGQSGNQRTIVYRLENDQWVTVTLGNYGFLDGVIGIGNKDNFVQYDGLRVEIEGQPLGTELSALAYETWKPQVFSRPGDDGAEFTQKVVNDGKQLSMSYYFGSYPIYFGRYPAALRLNVDCDDPLAITKVEFGPATQHAKRVYFGHGYCITEPERFEVTNGGHTLSTSHVGFDFDNGLSLLMATTTPPDRFIVDPVSKTYTLSVCPGTTMTLLPGTSGALDCAIRYRPLYDKEAAPGVANKAGRFVFDVWGGQYGDHLKKMQQIIDYGVTDALFVNHNWQRWGYDNRLPNIWPPNPRFGTLDEIKQMNELCKKHGILYGLHDNYIDIYPDADDFNYDVVSFGENGQPRKAWNNYGIDAQSYQLRPDKLMPFLERNFDMMMPELPLTTYFVDVFASINLHEFWDRNGNKHSRAEMLANWCKAFDTIRERLGNDFPTISEAGSDFLIGHLDGADCQFLTLSDEPGDFKITLRCKHWARVPWFDAVNHTRFSLHGVGYDSRYAAHRGDDLHGYMSDDYMSAEVLTGHAVQVGYQNMGRDAVRKYWLLQPVARNLAHAEIREIMYRGLKEPNYGQNADVLIVRWSNGTWTQVNRGSMNIAFHHGFDWSPFSPQYSYATAGDYGSYGAQMCSNINAFPFSQKNGTLTNQMIEYSLGIVGDERWVYFNPRQVGTNALPIMPIAKTFERVGDNQLKLTVDWNVFRSLKERNVEKHDVEDYAYFLHLEPPQMAWFERPKLTVIGGGMPQTPVSQWESNQTQDFGEITMPEELGSGTYNVLIGLWDADGDKQRAKLLGPSPDNSRILLGKLKLEKHDGKIVKLEFVPETEDSPELFARLLPAKKEVLEAIVAPGAMLSEQELPIPLRATGGVQLRYPKDAEKLDSVKITVIPLPEEPASTVVINVNATSNSLVPNVKYTKCESIIAVDRTGKKLRDVSFTLENDELRFDTIAGEFSYIAYITKK